MARDSFDRLMRYEVETVFTMVDELYKLGTTGQLEYEDAKRIATHLLREVRYELKDEIMGKGYFWADTSDGTNVVLYGKKDVEGKNRDNLQDANGTYMIKDLRKKAMDGGGYTDYWFPKLGEKVPLPKKRKCIMEVNRL